MPYARTLLSFVALSVAILPNIAAAETPGHITGVGGVFFTSKDPKALMTWYRDVLGLKIEAWGGVLLPYDAPDHPPVVTLNAFKPTSDYLAPSTREFMLNLAVDDLPAFLTRLKARGVKVLKTDDSDPSGRFAWIMDPDGTKIELWQPKAGPTAK